jgi:Transposase domain (DUF772)
MALGRAQVQQDFDDPRQLLGDRLREGSLYRLLADHGQVMFPDGYFADLYTGSVKSRPMVPARVVATVMLLQSFEGLSDREACDRLEFDLRWQAATCRCWPAPRPASVLAAARPCRRSSSVEPVHGGDHRLRSAAQCRSSSPPAICW